MSVGNSNGGRYKRHQLTHGRIIDRSSPFKGECLPVGSLSIADLGYLDWGGIAARRAAGSSTLTRAQARTNCWTPEGKPLQLDALLPQQVGQTHKRWVRVGKDHRHLMRLLILRVRERTPGQSPGASTQFPAWAASRPKAVFFLERE